MAEVFELAAPHLARSRREVWRQALQRLHVRQFVGADRTLASLGALTSGAVHRAHVSDLRVAVGVGGWGKPRPDAVRLQVGCFSTTATHDAARCGR